jgi:hypothetical protein
MKNIMSFFDIFKESNDFDEKNIIGFLSFAMMVFTAIVDITTGILGIDFLIHEYIYNSFLIVTLGSFGISGLQHIFEKNENKQDK